MSTSLPVGSEWVVSLVDAAARALTPVVVESAASEPRLFAYMDSVVRQPTPVLVLSPIASDALSREPTGWIQLHPLGQTEPWTLWVPEIRVTSPTRAEVPLHNARIHAAANPMNALVEMPNHPLVLVINGGVEDIETPVFPVIHIAADECTIESSSPLSIDFVFSSVEIAGERRILRRASARVLQNVAWVMADGTRRFRCRLSLGTTSVTESDEMYDLVKAPAQVRRLLDLAGLTNAPGWFEAPGWGRGAMHVAEVSRDTAVLSLNKPFDARRPPRIVRIGMEIFSAQYEMEVRALSSSTDEMQVALPLILRRRRRHRRAHRVAPSDQQRVRVVFRNPATGHHMDRPVVDVSFFGLAFTARTTDVLWAELPLESAALAFQELTVDLGDLDVRAVDRDETGLLCRVAITKPRVVDDPVLIDLIARVGHPDIAVHGGEDFQPLIDIYVRAGLFAPFMHRNLEATIEEVRDVWRALHTQAPDVVRTLVHGGEAPDGAVTAIRAWEHAWMAQHFVSVRPQLDGAAGALQMAYVDHVLPRPDAHFLLFFVKADNHRMNAFYERFFASTGTPEAVTRTTAELWTHRGEVTLPTAAASMRAYCVRELEQGDEAIVARAVRRVLGPMQAAALSMQAGELFLPDTSARFGRAGLVRTRSCRLVVDADGLPQYVIIEEVSSPGINLTWLLNTNWILPIHAHAEDSTEALATAIVNVLSRPAQSPTGDRFITVLAGTAPELLRAHGLTIEAPVHVYVMNRAGLHRYYFYTASRYGELDARTSRRRSKRPQP